MNEPDPNDVHARECVGDRLAKERKKQKLGLDEIAERTRIPVRHLEAIEASNHKALPAATYSAGFVKTYANLLGMDGTALGSDFRAELGDYRHRGTELVAFEPADPSRVPPKLLVTITVVAAMIFAAVYGLWRTTMTPDDTARLAAGTSAAPVVQPKPVPAHSTQVAIAPPPAAAAPSSPVVLSGTDKVWIKVTQADGPTLFMGVLEKGQSFTVPPTAKDPRLLTGRPEALRVMAGTAEIPPLAPPSNTVKNQSLLPDALLAIGRPEGTSAAPAGVVAPSSTGLTATTPPSPNAPAAVDPAAVETAPSTSSPAVSAPKP